MRGALPSTPSAPPRRVCAALLLLARGLCATLLLMALGFASPGLAAPALEPGVSLELARWRARHYRDVRYAIEMELRPGADTVQGRIEIRVSFRGAREDLVLDWRGGDPAARVQGLEANGRAVPAARFEAEHLVIPAAALKAADNVVSLAFRSPVSATGGPLARFTDRDDGAEYWHTLFVPADASSVFPCFDQPDLKARFTLTVSAPSAWRVVSNAPVESTRIEAGVARHRFRPTEPISTYVFAFAAGPFEALAEPGPRSDPGPVSLLVRRSKLARARGEAGAVLELNRGALAWFASYFGNPYPFPKYDLVLVPELAYGGMEHAGVSFLREESILFPFEPSAADRLRRSQLLLHETSHQWFGDWVTMRWFDDLWLKEGFANFMASKAAAELLPGEGIDPWVAFNALKSPAYRTDVTRGTTPIWQSMPNLAAAKSAYGNIVYAKAPAVLRQAEFYVGEAAFRRGVRDFLARHAYGAAGWSDLVRALERASGLALGAWAEAWVKRRGMPRVELAREPVRRGVALRQTDILAEKGRWPMRLQVAALAEGKVLRYRVRLSGERAFVPTPGAGNAELFFANDGDYGYGQFVLDAKSRETALADPGAIGDDLLRALVLESLWESVREAQLDPARYLELALRWTGSERDELTATVLLARLRAAYLRFLAPARRGAYAERVERLLATGMQKAPSVSRRIAYFRAFVDAAKSPAARGVLKNLLSGELALPGIPLSSRDRFRIVESLLASGDEEAPALLTAQARADPSAEGRRYAFGAAAAQPDAGVKRALFERFLTDAELAESWIEEALPAFNELEHAELTRPLLGQALAALPRLKRDRRIFFVNDWLAGFLGGQSSAEALETVDRFLKENALDPDLRLKVLEAVDVLQRTVKIRETFP